MFVNNLPLANTGVSFSALALGTVKFGRNTGVKYPHAFSLPDDNALCLLLNQAQSLGITTLDTAPAYGHAESIIGRLIHHERDQWQLLTKAGEYFNASTGESHYDFSSQSIRTSLESSLKHLQTDYVDCLLLHSDGNDCAHLTDDVIHTLQQCKQQGLTRAIGMSTKTVAGGKKALEHLDCIMMTASLHHTEEDSLFDYAQTLQKSILLKKIFDSGWSLSQPNQPKTAIMQATFNRLFQFPSVCCASMGTLNSDHLKQNALAYHQRQPL